MTIRSKNHLTVWMEILSHHVWTYITGMINSVMSVDQCNTYVFKTVFCCMPLYTPSLHWSYTWRGPQITFPYSNIGWTIYVSHNTHTRDHSFKLLTPPAYHLCRINFFDTRVINDWNNLTSDIVTNSSLNSFESAADNYFYDQIYVS